MKKRQIQQVVLAAFEQICPDKKGVLTREQAENEVKGLYLDVFERPADADAEGYILDLISGKKTPTMVEADLMSSPEAYEKAHAVVQVICLVLLGRDAGEKEKILEHGYRKGQMTREDITNAIKATDEYKELTQVRRIGKVSVIENALHDERTQMESVELGVSLFYAMSPDVDRERYAQVIDELSGTIEMVRFAGSTMTWDNPLGMRNVVPFKAGSYFRPIDTHRDGGPVDPMPDKRHFDELEWRLEYAESKGIRVQYTILWGGFQDMFRSGSDVRKTTLRKYIKAVAERLVDHPAHTIELINEADHGHHMGFLREKRSAMIQEMSNWVRDKHPNAVICVSDGGHPALNEDGEPATEEDKVREFFSYHGVKGLDYWNVHFPRDLIGMRGIPRWARGVYHLHDEHGYFAKKHKGLGYGRNDENMFLQTAADRVDWPYRGSTLDWRMYVLMVWSSTMAGAGTTIHNQKGFFCQRGIGSDPVIESMKARKKIIEGFRFKDAKTVNATWANSPVKDFRGGVYKAYSLKNHDGSDVMTLVLCPSKGVLTIQVTQRMDLRMYDPISGNEVERRKLMPGRQDVQLPAAPYDKALVLRYRKEAQ